MSGTEHPVIFVVSDGRGETCSQYLRAALVQYEDADVEMVVRSSVRTPELIAAVVDEAVERDGIIFYTLVGQDTRQAIRRCTSEKLVAAVDVLGPAFSALHHLFQQAPMATPGLFYEAERTRIDREAAVDFTLKHDDGQRPGDLSKADVVIVGVSRVAKSTTCFYLAYNGVKAANIPLVMGAPILPELLKVDPNKVIGLRMNLMRLMTVREARTRHLGSVGTAQYVDKREVAKEVLEAHQLMRRSGWRSFDVSYMAVEEIAREVLRLRGLPGTDH